MSTPPIDKLYDLRIGESAGSDLSQAEMRKRVEEILAWKPTALLVFFEVPGDKPGTTKIGVAGMGSAVDILTLYAASPDMMAAYHQQILSRGKVNG